MPIKVTLHEIRNAGPKQTEIAKRACEALQGVLNDPEFARRVAAASYRETRFADAQGNSRSVPPDEIFGYIASGAERGTAADQEIDLQVKLARMRSVGSTIPGRLPFRTAYWFVNQCIAEDDPASLAAHFLHEWLHVSGFYHHPDNSAREDVPYVLGGIVTDLLGGAKGFSGAPALESALAAAPYHGEEPEGAEEEADESQMM